MRNRTQLVLGLMGVFVAQVSCSGNNSRRLTSKDLPSVNGSNRSNMVTSALAPPGSFADAPAGESTCEVGKDSKDLCLAIKYVVYKDSSGQPILSKEEAISNVKAIGKVWSQCNLSFKIDDYQAINPADYGLQFCPADNSELSGIRKDLFNDSSFLVVTTGSWDRKGTLGNTPANAWTSMPGDEVFGAVLEKPVADFPNIIAHELGHYLNLLHVSDSDDLMNPVIYDHSEKLTEDQCAAARSAVSSYWSKMVR